MDITNKIQTILLCGNPHNGLEKLVYELSNQGLTRQRIYDLFLKYHDDYKYSDSWVETENKNNGDHPVDVILDRLSGWGAKYSILLANEPFQNK